MQNPILKSEIRNYSKFLCSAENGTLPSAGGERRGGGWPVTTIAFQIKRRTSSSHTLPTVTGVYRNLGFFPLQALVLKYASFHGVEKLYICSFLYNSPVAQDGDHCASGAIEGRADLRGSVVPAREHDALTDDASV